ncbi:YlcG family protein [Shimwellia blattae]|uniref:Putative phage protein n=1 Tax=Shimwellia blattae (strain ATCC 29907 / DSM 4481 / JCM 1650 / NBRC 105725 / CDC 9005-74) TaxID=630626 RepID=I2B9G5_SHIBC|nr:YlcG family protein [Shimwellia blattae]AFJ47169.1 putative phage protein [Shimwellia blattae DSM 4481 = NBRC 105725]VDY64660.1 Uncharacterised protein [Shimwellia blattae]VEC22766.1 Uncharacterised protein [Shimwellia blattae]
MGPHLKRVVIDHLHKRWQVLRAVRWSGSVLVDYRILKNYIKTMHGGDHDISI